MKGSPSPSISIAPSPRRASVASGAGSRPMSMAVGWNCTNSGSAITRAGERRQPRPSPRSSAGVVVTRVEAAEAAGGQDHGAARRCSIALASLARRARHEAGDAAVAPQQRTAQTRFEHLIERRAARGGGHRVHDRAAGLVALDPGDARRASGRPPGSARSAPSASRSKGAPRAARPRDGGGAFLGQQRGHVGIDEAGAGRDGVGGVQRRGRRPAPGPRPCRPAPRPTSSPAPAARR